MIQFPGFIKTYLDGESFSHNNKQFCGHFGNTSMGWRETKYVKIACYKWQ